MRIRFLPVLLGAVGLLGLCPLPLVASYAVGMLPKCGLRIQEYWEGGSSHYCIQNSLADSVVLVFRQLDFVSSPSTDNHVRVGGGLSPVAGDTLAVRKLPPRSLAFEPAVDLPLECHAEVLANGREVGLIACRPLPSVPAQDVVAMYSSLNTPCWEDDAAWTEQGSLWFESGSRFEVTLFVKSGAGVVEIPRTGDDDGRLYPYDVSSPTLVLSKRAEEFAMSASFPGVAEGFHRATLYFQAPSVDAPTLFWYCAFLSEQAQVAGHWIVRAVLVRP